MKFQLSLNQKIEYHLRFFVLIALILTITCGTALGQKKPATLKLDADADDKSACSQSPLKESKFCDLWKEYEDAVSRNDLTTARNSRNDMIEIVRGQVDTYFKLRKDGRKFKTKVFSQILDFLEIGGALAISIMNGTRAKSIVGSAIGALQGGRTSYNKNFDLLETQVLINKMNTNRALVFMEIVGNIDKPVRDPTPSNSYSWYAAKNDLRRYLLAGTYDNALDTLIRQTGSEVEKAEKDLRTVEAGFVVGEVREQTLNETRQAAKVLAILEGQLVSKKDETTTTLRAIVTALINKGGWAKAALSAEKITVKSEGSSIIEGLRTIKSKALDEPGGEELINMIDKAIVDTAGGQ